MKMIFLLSLLLSAPTFAAEGDAKNIPAPGRPNPDADFKPSPHDGIQPTKTSSSASVSTRKTAGDEERPLVGELVSLDDTLKILNKLKDFSGKIQGTKPPTLKRDVGALLAGDVGYRVEAIGCDKLNPLTDKDGRKQIMECTLQYSRVSKNSDTKIEINFGTDSWAAASTKIQDAVFKVVAE